jgi:hypothetical protein
MFIKFSQEVCELAKALTTQRVFMPASEAYVDSSL